MLVKNCFVCSGTRLHYLFSIYNEYRVVSCDSCGLMLINPQPSSDQLEKFYDQNYFLLSDSPEDRQHVAEIKRGTASLALDVLIKYRGSGHGSLLEIGCGHGDFLIEARSAGFTVTGLEYSRHACEVARNKLGNETTIIQGEIGELKPEQGLYDVCALSDVIEHVRDPRAFLMLVRKLLKPGGIIFLTAPDLKSWSAKLMKQKWVEFKPEHLTYFDNQTLQTLLWDTGFRDVLVGKHEKILSFGYVASHFEKFPVPFFSALIKLVRKILPTRLEKKPVKIVASGMSLIARASNTLNSRKKLSIIVPVFNEVSTVDKVLNLILEKSIAGLDKEIIVVESGSTDGSREIVRSFANRPGIRLVFEDRPLGKGHAVRAGFRVATGDFILIQDADLEYDFDDYESLLHPLTSGEAAFVLGARHGGKSWKMRVFEGQPLHALLLNLGHWFFTGLIDILYFQKLKDPFTMFKVFRRDCLYGLTFECNRFDFDFELLIKLIRKGYTPVEIPVNYRSRSFHEGKKIRIFRDPWTWLRALLKYRLVSLNLLSQIQGHTKDQQSSTSKSETSKTPTPLRTGPPDLSC